MTKGYRSQPGVLVDDIRPLHGASTLVVMRAVEEIMRPEMRSADMRSETRVHSDDERALRWLKHRLEWEEILGALRDAGGRRVPAPARARQEPAAA
jgi:hypothetical protein